eukprot:3801339-Alexandrium_andersonii.AAC.1
MKHRFGCQRPTGRGCSSKPRQKAEWPSPGPGIRQKMETPTPPFQRSALGAPHFARRPGGGAL